ncbi:MAG: hypothetical protein FJ267_13135, partial [Planctomycetes bacterium]|nr:hypothetical protein [Planctomycetota bacterium]
MATATTLATLTVISGPDQGKTFSLADEVVHVGRSDDCQVLLSDVSLDSVQVSFANRNNRFAVFTSLKEGVKVDGKGIPIEQWVWLPSRATLQISSNTTLQFTANGTDTAELKESRPTDGRANSPAKETSAPGTAPSKGRKKGSKKNESTSRTVAKFITDRAGETLVRLGE